MTALISFNGLPLHTTKISENLIIGARQPLKGLRQLKTENVNTIIDLRNRFDFKKMKEAIFCKLLGIKHINIPLQLGNKSPLTIDVFSKVAETIQNNKTGKTFLHCNHGFHRTPIVTAFVKIKNGTIKTFEEFDEFLKQHNYYKLNPKSRLGIKFNLTPNDIKMRTDNLNYQKFKVWEIFKQFIQKK